MERRKLTGKDKVFNVFNYGVFGLLTLICAYPFYYLIINTLSANDLSAAGEILFFPKGFHLDNYKQVLKLNGIFNAAVISVARTVLGTALSVLASHKRGCKHRKGCSKDSPFCACIRVYGIYVYLGADVGKKVLVSLCSDHHVF